MQTQLFQSVSTNTKVKLDPRTKIYLLLVVNIIVLNSQTIGAAAYIKALLAFIPFFLLLTVGRKSGALWFVVLYAAAQCGRIFFYNMTNGAMDIAIRMLVEIMLRFAPCAVLGYYMLSTTRVSEFLSAMNRMHLTQKLTIPLSVMFRFLPTIAEEHRSIRDAMRMRGIGGGFLKNPAAALEYRMVPLMMSIVKIGNELSAAALTRGLGGPVKRTNVCKIGFGTWDAVFFMFATALQIAFVLLIGGK